MKREWIVAIVIFLAGFGLFSICAVSIRTVPFVWAQRGARGDLTRIVRDCSSQSNRTHIVLCMRNALMVPIKKWGLRPFMQVLGDMEMAGTVSHMGWSNCHDIAHALGQAASIETTDINNVFMSCNDACSYGCYHGAMEGIVASGRSFTTLLPTVCLSPALDQQTQFECAHGAGHAIATYTDHNLAASMDDCDKLPQKLRVYCGLGVFHELFDSVSYPDTVEKVPANHPAWCGSLRLPYSFVCYSTAGMYEYTSTRSLARAIAVCRQVPQVYQEECFVWVGKYTLSTEAQLGEDMAAVQAFCQQAEPANAAQCAGDIVNRSSQ